MAETKELSAAKQVEVLQRYVDEMKSIQRSTGRLLTIFQKALATAKAEADA